VGSFDFSLDDIEHGILRGSPEGDARSFSEEDRRKFLAADKVRLSHCRFLARKIWWCARIIFKIVYREDLPLEHCIKGDGTGMTLSMIVFT